MPYIVQSRRDELETYSYSGGMPEQPQTTGELNYIITNVLREYWERHRNYTGINDILGALEGAKLEFYRRVVVPYEDQKIKENGDVY